MNDVRMYPPIVGDQIALNHVRANPIATLENQASISGNIFRYVSGTTDTVVINDPAYVRHVLVDASTRYSKVGTPELFMLRTVLGDGLMTVEGDDWTCQRELANPHFSEGCLRSYFPAMKAEAATLLQRWSRYEREGSDINISAELSAFTLRIVARCLFNSLLTDEETNDIEMGVSSLNEFMACERTSIEASNMEYTKAMQKITGIVWSIVFQNNLDRDNLRDTLLSAMFDKVEGPKKIRGGKIVDQVLTYLMAGHETTAKALTWCLYLLGTRPKIQDELWIEQQKNLCLAQDVSYKQLQDFPLYENVLYETMRLYPPVWMISRKSLCDDQIGDFKIAAGSLMVISPYLLHRKPEIWQDPEKFLPKRFHGNSARLISECSYIPFGAGSRMCIGRRFGMTEMLLFLLMLISKFKIELTTPNLIVPQALVTLKPASPVLIKVRKR